METLRNTEEVARLAMADMTGIEPDAPASALPLVRIAIACVAIASAFFLTAGYMVG